MEIEIKHPQVRLAELLKRKGIGPEASKSLKEEEITELKQLLLSGEVSLTTKATMLTALFTLDPTPIERDFISEIKADPEQFLPLEIVEMLFGKSEKRFVNIIRKTINNSDLDEEESFEGMKCFLDENEPEMFKAAFLEAERLKRETFIENKVFFSSLWDAVEHRRLSIPVLIGIADAYDGCNRTRHFSVFVAAVIASMGFPVYLHGVDAVAPKEGVTTHQILKAAGKNPIKTSTEVIEDILNSKIGWGYLDQSVFFPKLYLLKRMGKEMVKRPFLATFEKLLQPIIAENGNCIVTGYTHSHYREELVNQLKEQAKCKKAIVLKGVEGSTQLSMSRETIAILYDGNNITDTTIQPENFRLDTWPLSRDMSITAEVSLKEGIAALQGTRGFARQNIIYTAAIIVSKFGLLSSEEAIEKIEASIGSGQAYQHWIEGSN